jgi:hypothetical protein
LHAELEPSHLLFLCARIGPTNLIETGLSDEISPDSKADRPIRLS